MANLFIPSKIKVGFQKRSDTFTGKLAYVIYFDEKGKLRKETSWEGWRDQKIESVEFENKPNSGYLFNKGVQRGGYDWGTGRSSIRVFDPRDFEFEITVDNLMGILMHSDVSKRDIIEECVFAWEGKELVLLPINSEEYQKSVEYTQKQSEKLSTKELVKGYSYNQKKSEGVLIYVGHLEWFDWGHEKNSEGYTHRSLGKKHVFYNESAGHFVTPGIATFSSINSAEVVDNYASIVDEFFKTVNSQSIVGVKSVSFPTGKQQNYGYAYKIDKDIVEKVYAYFQEHHKDKPFHQIDYHSQKMHLTFKDGKTKISQLVNNDRNHHNYYYGATTGPIEKQLIAKANELGFDTKNMNLDKFFKTFDAENYKKLVFVLENGNTCDASNI